MEARKVDATIAVLDDAGRIARLLPPLRRQILRRLQDEPDSATGLARKLGLPRQKLNYHLRELERAGFVELAEERQRRGCVERTLRPTARVYLLDPAALGDLAVRPDEVQDRFSSGYLMAVAAQTVRDVSQLRRGADRAKKKLPTLTLQADVRFRTTEDRAAFAEALAEALARLVAEYDDTAPGSRAFRFVVGGYPVVRNIPSTKEEST
jgi:DNA-binding transcriptional ArsR family regulator